MQNALRSASGSRLLVDPVQLVLRQHGAQLFDDGVQLMLVAQPPAAEKLLIDPHCCADEPQLLEPNPGADLQVPTPDEERVQGAVRCGLSAKSSQIIST